MGPSKKKSPLQLKLPSKETNTDDRDFKRALPTAVDIKVAEEGQTDCYCKVGITMYGRICALLGNTSCEPPMHRLAMHYVV